MKYPLVSVVIPLYKPERTIKRCIESLLKQEYKPIEIIVIDSKFKPIEDKKLLSYLKKHTTYLTDGPERSIQRNRGINKAKGTYLYIIDQDMYIGKKVIAECVEKMEAGNFVALTIPEISIGEGFWTECVALERYVNTYLEVGQNECCRFFKKRDIKKIGLYDPSIVGAEDADVHNKMAALGNIGKTKASIYHDEGKTEFWGRVRKKYYYSRAFRTYLKRYPQLAAKQFSPLKFTYMKHWKYFAKKPKVTLGVIALRGAEVTAGVLGLLFNNDK